DAAGCAEPMPNDRAVCSCLLLKRLCYSAEDRFGHRLDFVDDAADGRRAATAAGSSAATSTTTTGVMAPTVAIDGPGVSEILEYVPEVPTTAAVHRHRIEAVISVVVRRS